MVGRGPVTVVRSRSRRGSYDDPHCRASDERCAVDKVVGHLACRVGKIGGEFVNPVEFVGETHSG
jgi:hypothetical protein